MDRNCQPSKEIRQMSKTSKFTTALLAIAGAAFSQDMNRILGRDSDTSAQRGSLLRQNNPGGVPADTQRQLSDQLRADNQQASYKRGELIHQQLFQACMEKENKKRDANPYNCQNEKNIQNYYAGMAAAVQKPQQAGTTEASRALRFPVPLPPPSQVGQTLPKMPSYTNGRRQ